jgi:molecular chaperone GrpE
LDSFELSIAALEKQEEAVDKGIYMIKGQLEDVLKRRGLERIKAKKGDMFDPQYHEAISSVESEGESGTILEEIEAGYTLYGKVIRASRVRTIQ